MELPRIRRLDAHVVAQIAAGEVIESPAAIVKELIENAIDAAADSVEIRVSGDGFSEIEVRDNGHGIHPEDLPLAVESFTTSKIRDLADFASANTMGFRGEALGSIAAVSRLRIESLRRGMPHAMAISVEDESSTMEPVALPEGTRVIVRDLFYNAPVRKEYFNNRIKIRRQLAETLTSFAAVYPEISFRWTLNEEEPVYPVSYTHL
ncbi:MAG: DNA mismatch repair endonuclease MutL, partial [Turneriella sp.]|nr:DNA mismatch repair endonuclease MutL [Turneriella sp.]